MGYRVAISRDQLIFALSLGVAGILLAKAGFGIFSAILLLEIWPETSILPKPSFS